MINDEIEKDNEIFIPDDDGDAQSLEYYEISNFTNL